MAYKSCFVFISEADAEAFVTDGYPKYGTNINDNTVYDRGVTTRAANWKKNPSKDEWYVVDDEDVFGPETDRSNLQDIDWSTIFPLPKFP